MGIVHNVNIKRRVLENFKNEKFLAKGFLTLKFPLCVLYFKKGDVLKLQLITKFVKILIQKKIKFFAITEKSNYVGVHCHILIDCDINMLDVVIQGGMELINSYLLDKRISKFLTVKTFFKKEIYHEEIVNGQDDKSVSNVVNYMLKNGGGISESKWYSNILGLENGLIDDDHIFLLKLRSKYRMRSMKIISLLYDALNYGLVQPVTVKEFVEMMIYKNKIIFEDLIYMVNRYEKKTKFLIGESKKNYLLMREQIFKEFYNSFLMDRVYKFLDPKLFETISSCVIELFKADKRLKLFVDEINFKVEKFRKKVTKKKKFNFDSFTFDFYIQSIVYQILGYFFKICDQNKKIIQYTSKAQLIELVLESCKIAFTGLFIDKQFFTEYYMFILFEYIIYSLEEKNIKIFGLERFQSETGFETLFYFEDKEKKVLSFDLIDPEAIIIAKLMMGVFLIPPLPGKDVMLKKDVYKSCYDGVYIFNKIFKFLSFIHKKQINESLFDFSLDVYFIDIKNRMQNQEYKVDSLFMEIFREKMFSVNQLGQDGKIIGTSSEKNYYDVFKENSKNIFNVDKKKKLYNKGLQDYKKYCFHLFLNYVENSNFYFGLYLDVRGRTYMTGGFNMQSEKWLRAVVCFANKKKEDLSIDLSRMYLGVRNRLLEDVNNEIIKEIEDIISVNENKYKNFRECISLFTENFGNCLNNIREEKYLKHFLILIRCLYKKYKIIYGSDDRDKVYIPYISYNDFHAQGSLLFNLLLRNYNIINNYNKKNFDYYSGKGQEFVNYIKCKELKEIEQVLSLYSEKVGRKVVKRCFMTLIYSATLRTLRRYFIEGLNSEGIFIEDKNIYFSLIKNFLEFLKKEPIIAYLKNFSNVIDIVGEKLPLTIEEKKKIMTIQYGDAIKYTNFYVSNYIETYSIRVKKNIKKVSILKIDKENADVYKLQLSSLVNSIHYLDAIICHEISKFFLRKNSNIITIHDSFGVTYKEKDDVIQVFFSFLLISIKKSETFSFFSLYAGLFESIKKNVIIEDNWLLDAKDKEILKIFYNESQFLEKNEQLLSFLETLIEHNVEKSLPISTSYIKDE